MFKNQDGYYPHHQELYPMLGLGSGAHLPDDGFDTTLNGVRFTCLPKITHKANGHKSSKHRLFFHCKCGRAISFGRACQHIPTCKAS